MSTIPAGTRREVQVLVSNENAITFLGVEGARVLSTPHMIALMEKNCRDAVLPLLDAGYDTVGTHVNVAHLAAAPMGTLVTFRAEITGVNGRRVEFRVEAATDREKIGEGTHERTIIDVAKFAAKQAAKRELAGQSGAEKG